MLRFRDQIEAYIYNKLPSRNILIHSHERCRVHDISTFHGPPFSIPNSLFLKYFSKRVQAWTKMERDEICSSQVSHILPVSKRVGEELLNLHPELENKNIVVAYPGTGPTTYHSEILSPTSKSTKENTLKCVFIGKEWKRKGLERAIDIVKNYPTAASLDIFGVSEKELPKFARNSNQIRALGWQHAIPWKNYSVLIHPAKNEPFGMAISEARANGLAVLTSDQVGSVELGYTHLIAVPSSAPINSWIQGLKTLEHSLPCSSETLWTWEDLAQLHANRIYPDALYLKYRKQNPVMDPKNWTAR